MSGAGKVCVQASWAHAFPLSTKQWKMQCSPDFTLLKLIGVMVMVCRGGCALGMLAQFSLFPPFPSVLGWRAVGVHL